ncbi:MAG: trehalose-phosphatase [Candidatus Omnitrophica bacterium]|nr:trehalose-phosphatase [Candidatus Omnitrophota bacterium]
MVYLFLDYDGTIVPIADTPAKAVIPKRTKELLRRLALAGGFKLAVISGRSLKDVKKMVGVRGIVYSGNHGIEVSGPGIRPRSFAPAGFRGLIKRIAGDLRKRMAGVNGVVLEDKGYSLSVHYRLVSRKDIPRVRKAFRAATARYIAGGKARAGAGKMVLEIKPPVDWDKGKLVMWLLARQRPSAGRGRPVLPVYIGDDITDEDAFAALGNKGITVFVGKPGRTKAAYFLKDHREVIRFLRQAGHLEKE